MRLRFHKLNLWGGVQFPTGGIVREPSGMNWCNSGTDSIVWMIKGGKLIITARAPSVYAVFYFLN